MRQKNDLFAVNLRRISEVFALRGSWRKLWAHFHDLCVQKWSCFLRRSDAFWRFSPCEVYKKSSGRIFTIYVSKNEAVCRNFQTHFGGFLRANFMKKVVGTFSQFLRPIMKLFAVEFRRILEVLRIQGLQKISGRIFTIFVSKNDAVFREVQTHFRSFRFAR